jgi:hypothetical protein
MRFADVIVAITNLRVVTVHHNKNTQLEIILIEATVWVFLVLFFGVSFLLTKVTL